MHRRHAIKVAVTIFVVLAAIAGSVAWIYTLNKAADVQSVDTVVSSVSKHMILPKDEKPALATVTDNSKLDTEFLQKAENGDKLLVYQRAKTAILYRPSIDKIVAVGPVTIESLTEDK